MSNLYKVGSLIYNDERKARKLAKQIGVPMKVLVCTRDGVVQAEYYKAQSMLSYVVKNLLKLK